MITKIRLQQTWPKQILIPILGPTQHLERNTNVTLICRSNTPLFINLHNNKIYVISTCLTTNTNKLCCFFSCHKHTNQRQPQPFFRLTESHKHINYPQLQPKMILLDGFIIYIYVSCYYNSLNLSLYAKSQCLNVKSICCFNFDVQICMYMSRFANVKE